MTYVSDSLRAIERCMAEEGRLGALVAHVEGCATGGGVVYTIGNGGGQATAEHWAAHDQTGRWVPAVASAALLSALANDYGLESAYDVALGGARDVDLLVAFTVGGSRDVLTAVRNFPGQVDLFTGSACVKLTPRSNLTQHVAPSEDPRIVEDCWSVLGHALVGRLS